MSLALQHSETTDAFQSLSLSIPVDTAKYKKMYLFLSKVLNVSDENVILLTEEKGRNKSYIMNREPIEVLSRVYLPHDTWLKGEVTIKDIKIKTNMLLEINNMIEKELPQGPDHIVRIDDEVISYYEKLLTAFKVFEVPDESQSAVDESPVDSVKEEEEEEEASLYDSNEISRIESNTSTASLRTRLSIFNSYNSKRSSSSSVKRRILSIQQGPDSVDGPKIDDERKAGLNSLLSKSRIYNRLKKHRLTGSVNSNISLPSSVNFNRNSMGTTTANGSYSSTRRGSSTFASPEITEGRVLDIPSPSLSQTLILTATQKQENQKDKFEYYSQMKRLKLLTRRVIKHLDHTQGSYDLVKILDFINRYVVKFIFIDICQMIIIYGQRKTYTFYPRP